MPCICASVSVIYPTKSENRRRKEEKKKRKQYKCVSYDWIWLLFLDDIQDIENTSTCGSPHNTTNHEFNAAIPFWLCHFLNGTHLFNHLIVVDRKWGKWGIRVKTSSWIPFKYAFKGYAIIPIYHSALLLLSLALTALSDC